MFVPSSARKVQDEVREGIPKSSSMWCAMKARLSISAETVVPGLRDLADRWRVTLQNNIYN